MEVLSAKFCMPGCDFVPLSLNIKGANPTSSVTTFLQKQPTATNPNVKQFLSTYFGLAAVGMHLFGAG